MKLILFLIPLIIFGEEKPKIPLDLELDFERARANEQESNSVQHRLDVEKLNSIFNKIKEACPNVQRPDRDKKLDQSNCNPQPIEKKEEKK